MELENLKFDTIADNFDEIFNESIPFYEIDSNSLFSVRELNQSIERRINEKTEIEFKHFQTIIQYLFNEATGCEPFLEIDEIPLTIGSEFDTRAAINYYWIVLERLIGNERKTKAIELLRTAFPTLTIDLDKNDTWLRKGLFFPKYSIIDESLSNMRNSINTNVRQNEFEESKSLIEKLEKIEAPFIELEKKLIANTREAHKAKFELIKMFKVGSIDIFSRIEYYEQRFQEQFTNIADVIKYAIDNKERGRVNIYPGIEVTPDFIFEEHNKGQFSYAIQKIYYWFYVAFSYYILHILKEIRDITSRVELPEQNNKTSQNKPTVKQFALYYYYLIESGIEPRLDQRSCTKDEACKQIGANHSISGNKFEQAYNEFSDYKEGKNRRCKGTSQNLKDFERVIYMLSENQSAKVLAQNELKQAIINSDKKGNPVT